MDNDEKLIRKFADKVFIEEDEKDALLAFLRDENLIEAWSKNLERVFDSRSGGDIKIRFQGCVKQIFRQINTTRRGSKRCTEDDAKLLLQFTRSILLQFVRENLDEIPDIVKTFRDEMKELVISRKEIEWDQVEYALDFFEMINSENSMREKTGGEKVIASGNTSLVDSKNKIETEVHWVGDLGKLEKLGNYLEKDLKWILNAQDFVAFFDPQAITPFRVYFRKANFDQICLLVRFLNEIGKFDKKKSKGFWKVIAKSFCPEDDIQIGEDWSKRASRKMDSDPIMKGFRENMDEVISILEVPPDEQKRFFKKNS